MRWSFAALAARICIALAVSGCSSGNTKDTAAGTGFSPGQPPGRASMALAENKKTGREKNAGSLAHPESEPLLPFFFVLKELESGARETPVNILQIGDSHTAGDYLSGRLRELLQNRFGAAGRGFLPPGFPDKYYKPDLIKVTQSAGWLRLRSTEANSTERFGIAGVAQRSTKPRQRMSILSTEAAGFDHGFVEVLGPARFSLTFDNAETREFDISGDAPNGEWIEFDAPAGSQELVLETGNSPVTLLAWGVQRKGAGILYSNLGTIGAQAKLMGRWDAGIVRSELQHLDPALILIAFGTNEAFGERNDLINFYWDFSDPVAFIAKSAPNAAIVIIGPPDSNRLYRRPAGVYGDCTDAALSGPPLALAANPAQKKRPFSIVWATPEEVTLVEAEEMRIAADHGWYFWDWSAVMGGSCSAHRWSVRNEPLVRPDHIHQTMAGYRFSAELLYRELMTGYGRYRKETGISSSLKQTRR
ncbi:MAG: hypothetical protein LBV49_03900 [Azonexus sp.]|jgi:hypothetical protein|nr:hypothetical protein [Azonexus sp.]